MAARNTSLAMVKELIIDHKGLAADAIKTLTLGLSCAIGPPKHSTLDSEINNFITRIEEYYHLHYSKANRHMARKVPLLKQKLNVLKEQMTAVKLLPHHSNLSKLELSIIHKLAKDKSIVIKKADKGASIVIWLTEDYEREGLRILSDILTFECITEEADKFRKAAEHEASLLCAATRMQTITPKRRDSGIQRKKKMSNIYFLPKVHKGINPDTGTYKGRPIVSACAAPTKMIDLILTEIFTPLLDLLPERLKDTKAFLRYLSSKTRIPDGTQLISFDIESLYPSIPQSEAIEVMVNFLNEHRHTAKARYGRQIPSDDWIREALKFVMGENIFKFKDKYYRQVKGTSMGSSISVALAEIFVHKIIECNPIRKRCCPQWRRYIDDIFVTVEENINPKHILTELNKIHDSIKFTMEKGNPELTFLDTKVYIQDNEIHTCINYKESDRHLYLHSRSYHPKPVKKSVPYSQCLRVIRNTSCPVKRDVEVDKMLDFFFARGYTQRFLKNVKIQLSWTIECRDVLLKDKPNKKTDILDTRIPMPLIFHPGLSHVQPRLVHLHNELMELFDELPEFPPRLIPMVAWKKNLTFKDILVKAEHPRK